MKKLIAASAALMCFICCGVTSNFPVRELPVSAAVLEESTIELENVGEISYYEHENSIEIIKWNENAVNAVVPETIAGKPVTAVSWRCFADCTNLETLEFPDTVTSIGTSCCYMLKKLKSVKLPENLISLGSMAFSFCESLESVTITEVITTL